MTDASAQTQNKKIYTREEFEELRIRKAREMKADESLQKDAFELFARADEKYWVHQTNWFGEPILNLPQDMFALQEIMFRTRPDYVLEIGAAWGGSLLFYSTIMEAIGGKGVIAVDIFIPDDLKERIGRHGRISDRIRWVQGSSTEQSTLGKVKDLIGEGSNVLVILDSDHTHDHVLKELRLYAPLVRPGQYLVCSDGVIEKIPPNPLRPRSWGPGDNPLTAINAFLKEDQRFVVDEDLEAKLLLTCNPRGYLRRIENFD
ncbi:MAG: cephalosporin hydroxylase family protein [Euryarchaeota archaeon]|nr:cephalosporin hydroxylase family protein [Euryarchaeota archaeon]